VVCLSEVANIRNGAGIKQEFFVDQGIPLVKVSNLTLNSINIEGLTNIDLEHAKKWESHKLHDGEILIATVGSWPPNWSSVVGKVIRVPAIASGMIQNQNTACITPKNDNVDNDYLYYLLKNKSFLIWVSNTAQGSANQARIAIKELGKFSFKLPALSEQQFIGRTLRALDDKISINHSLNATLESLAQAIFKSWFADFEPTKAKIAAREALMAEDLDATPDQIAAAEQQAAIQAIAGVGEIIPTEQLQTIADLFPNQLVDSEIGKIPLSWSVSDLNVVTEKISKGTTPRKKDLENTTDSLTIKFIKVKDIAKNGDIDIKSLDTIPRSVHEGVIKRSILKTDDVLFSIAGTIGRVAIIDEQLTDSNCNQAVAFIRLKEPSVYRDFIYLLLKTKLSLTTN